MVNNHRLVPVVVGCPAVPSGRRRWPDSYYAWKSGRRVVFFDRLSQELDAFRAVISQLIGCLDRFARTTPPGWVP